MNKQQLQNSNRNLKLVARATTVIAIVKGGLIVGPKALTFIKGSTMFLGCLPIPNYFSLLAGGLFAADVVLRVKAQKDKIAEEKAKKKNFYEDELFQLED